MNGDAVEIVFDVDESERKADLEQRAVDAGDAGVMETATGQGVLGPGDLFSELRGHPRCGGLVNERPGDGRHTNAVLTDAGFACISEAAPRHVETARDLVLDQLTGAQLQALGEAAQAILERIDPGATYPPFTNSP